MEEIKLKSNRKTRFYSLGISAGVFKNEDEAIKYANNLKIYLERTCKKNKYDCFALFSVSQNNAKKDIKHMQYSGKAGRPRAAFTSIDKNDGGQVDQHIHIAFWANPCSQIANCIIKKVIKDFGKEYGETHISINDNKRMPYWKEKLSELADFITYVKYILKQSFCNRTLYFNSNNLIDFAFIKELLKNIDNEIKQENRELLANLNTKKDKHTAKSITFKQYLIIIFTLSRMIRRYLNSHIITAFADILRLKKLECNNTIYIYIYKFIDYNNNHIRIYFYKCLNKYFSNKDPPIFKY